MNRKSVTKDVLYEYEEIRTRNDHILDARKEKLYSLSPELKEIDDEIFNFGITTLFAIAKKEGKNPEEIAEHLKAVNKALLDRKANVLLRLGYETDYLDKIYDCELCKDTGYIDNKEKCICFKQKMIEKYYSMSRIKDILKRENFENFDFDLFSDEKINGESPRDNIKANYKMAQNFVYNFPNKFENILLYGATGLGKTYLCNCIAKAIIDKGHQVLYATAGDLFQILENYKFHREDMENPEYYISLINDCDLLIIDDLGTEMTSIFTASSLFNVINSRINAEKHTIISTNMELTGIEKAYSHRVSSRIIGSYNLLEFKGDDLRIRKKFKGIV